MRATPRLFGYLLADLSGGSASERLASAVAYGSAAAGLPGTTIPAPAQTHPELVTVRLLHVSPAIHSPQKSGA